MSKVRARGSREPSSGVGKRNSLGSLLDQTLAAAAKDVQTATARGQAVNVMIDGVSIRDLPTLTDERGSVFELYDVRWAWHPDALVFPKSWKGVRYWYAATPYPYGNAAFENPSAYVGNYRDDWHLAAGATNPIAMPGRDAYLSDPDILYDPALVLPGNWEPTSGYDGTMALLDLPQPPTAIFAASDMIAVGVYDALRERGLRIPEDVSVVGYDDREIARFMRPALTTVVLPHTAMGRQAVEAIVDGQTLPGPRQPQIKVECPLVERHSVAPPRR